MSILLYLDRFAITPIATTIMLGARSRQGAAGPRDRRVFLRLRPVPGARRLAQRHAGGAAGRWPCMSCGWSLATIGLGLASGLLAISLMRIVLGHHAGGRVSGSGQPAQALGSALRPRAGEHHRLDGRPRRAIRWPSCSRRCSSRSWRAGWAGRPAAGASCSLPTGRSASCGRFVFVWLYRDSPRQHPWCNEAERELIGEQPAPASQPKFGYSQQLLTMLTSPNVWLMCLHGNLGQHRLGFSGHLAAPVFDCQASAAALGEIVDQPRGAGRRR